MGAVEAFDAGFTAQLSVMPPGAKVAPNSKLDEADAGKAPALRGYDGRYHGYNWMNSRPSRDSVAGWLNAGSNIGFLASEYPAIDIDIMNERIARSVVQAVTDAMGPCLVRVGQYPKHLLIFRCDEPLRSFDMHYEKWNALLGTADKQLIQFLGRGRQYVMFGTHPGTMRPYEIFDPGYSLSLGPLSLPVLTPEKVVELFDIINDTMSQFGYTTSSNAEARVHGGDVDQDDLKAPSLGDLASLIERMPNNLPDRDEYITIGYAIKAASQEDQELGFEIFMDWCARWDLGSNDPAVVRRDWDKMVPPYRMGYDFLLQKAGSLGADISDFRFGPGELAPAEAAGEPIVQGDDAEVQASRAALQAASLDGDAVLSDRWFAKKFLRLHGPDFMIPIGMASSYCYHWDSYHWRKVPRGEITHRVADFLTAHVSMAKQLYESPKEAAAAAMRLGATKTIQNVVTQVVNSSTLIVEMDQLDASPDLLDTPNGPIYLPTGELLAPNKDYKLTKATTVSMDPSAHCPVWRRFIAESTRGDAQLAFLLQCLAGYSLTGHTREQIFPFFIGHGKNGKSTFIKVLMRILGENAVTVPVELFQSSNRGSDNAAYQLARIHGARLVTTSETKAGGTWDEQRVKQITGEDEIVARQIYGQPFSFEAKCTLIVIGNYAPDLEEVTEAMSRRIRVIPWDYTPAKADDTLFDKLQAELPGILTWCVEGAMAWYQHGMPDSTIARDVTMTYLSDQDTLGQWLQDVISVTLAREDFVSNVSLYNSYATWCRTEGATPMSNMKFARRVIGPLRTYGAKKIRSSEHRGWVGIKLKAVQDAPSNVMNFPTVAKPSGAK